MAQIAEVPLTEQQLDFIGELSVNYMRTRYPDEEAELAAATTHDKAEATLQAAEAMTRWLLSMLT